MKPIIKQSKRKVRSFLSIGIIFVPFLMRIHGEMNGILEGNEGMREPILCQIPIREGKSQFLA